VLLNGVAATAAAARLLLLEFLLLLRELRLQAPDVGLRRLVVRRVGDFFFERFDLLLDTH